MNFSRKYFKSYDLLLIITGVAAVSFYLLTAGWGFPLDDSWIHQGYARNLAQYGEWALIPGTPSAASTAPLYTLALAVGSALNISPLAWSHLLGTLALILTAIFNARLAEHLLPDTRYIGALTGMATLLTWHLIWASVSGMETMMFSCAVSLLLLLGWREIRIQADTPERHIKRGAVFGLATALTVCLRPEGVLMAGLIGLGLLVARPQGSLRSVVIWGLSAAAFFMVGMAPYFLLNLSTTGGIFPNTMAAKKSEFAALLTPPYTHRLLEMLFATRHGAHIFLLIGCIAYLVTFTRNTKRTALLYLSPLLWILLLAGLYASILVASYQHGRYMMPTIPSIVLCGIYGAVQLSRVKWERYTAFLRIPVKVWIISTGLLYLIYFAFIGPITLKSGVQFINEELVESAHWVRDNLPEGLLVVHDIGAIGYFAPRPILDIAGLVSPELIPFIKDSERLWAYIEAQGGRYLLVMGEFLPDPAASTAPLLCPIFHSEGKTAVRNHIAPSVLYVMQWERQTCDEVDIPPA